LRIGNCCNHANQHAGNNDSLSHNSLSRKIKRYFY
jgi:hypothetical protein